MSILYIISQIVTILMFVFLGISYYFKDRKKILLSNIFAQICQIVATLLLGGFTGALMSVVMLICYSTMYVDYILNRQKNKTRDYFIFTIYFVLIIIVTAITYSGYASLIVEAATILLLIALLQRNLKIYKVLGILGTILWIIYYNHLCSIFGVVLNIILLTTTLISFKKNK